MDKQLYRINEVTEILGISRRQVYNLLNEGHLKGHTRHPGKKGMRITRKSILEYIEIYTQNPIKL
jgi:excisionase family DNA binding protein